MPPTRPFWKGYLKLSLVSCPIALYTATSSSEWDAARLEPLVGLHVARRTTTGTRGRDPGG
jgi:non-homologous end joining protein Ku